MQTKIFDYGMNGEGVAKIDGKIYLINNALIDEVVDITTVEDNENYAIATINEIIEKSNNRVCPHCPHYNNCGGCQLQHMSYAEQLKFKQILIKKTLKKISNLSIEVNNTVGCENQFGYRNKMSFSVSKSQCGLLQENSKTIVDINSCPLTSKNINTILMLFKSSVTNELKQHIKNLVIREINNQILVGIVTTKHLNLNDFMLLLKQNFISIGLYEIINTRNDSVVLSGKVNHIGGIKEINIVSNVSTNVIKYSVDLMGFHQTNLEIQNKLYEKVLNYISSNSTVVNGFSGQGLLSAILATKAKKVIGIELNKSSHISAEALKKQNKITNLTNVLGDFNKEIDKYKAKADTLILDPTKKGCGKTVMNKIKGIKNIVYISCNPIALCKDLNQLKEEYDIEEVTPFDMFPNTTSVETLVKLKIKEK